MHNSLKTLPHNVTTAEAKISDNIHCTHQTYSI